MMSSELDPDLIADLRSMARQGAETKDLVAHIRKVLGMPDGMVMVLAYVCTAFHVPLPVALPLREDEGTGAFGRAIQVAFWFSALVSEHVEARRWNWDTFWRSFGRDFSAESLRCLNGSSSAVRFVHPPQFPDETYARALHEAFVDKMPAFEPPAHVRFNAIKGIAADFRRVAGINLANGGLVKAPLLLRFEFQIEDQGPKFRVTCIAQALTDVHLVSNEEALAPA